MAVRDVYQKIWLFDIYAMLPLLDPKAACNNSQQPATISYTSGTSHTTAPHFYPPSASDIRHGALGEKGKQNVQTLLLLSIRADFLITPSSAVCLLNTGGEVLPSVCLQRPMLREIEGALLMLSTPHTARLPPECFVRQSRGC